MAGTLGDTATGAKKLIFSADELPDDLDENARFDFFTKTVFEPLFGSSEIRRAPVHRFDAHFEYTAMSQVVLAKPRAHVSRWTRTARHVATDNRHLYQIGFNVSRYSLAMRQGGRETEQKPGGVAMITSGEPLDMISTPGMSTICLGISAAHLRARIPDVDDRLLQPLDPAAPAVRYLRRYVESLLEADDIAADDDLRAIVERTLIDLAVLALGGRSESWDLAKLRGVRAARLREITILIRRNYADPAFSSAAAAARLGISLRYLHGILQETGRSFSERVLELRLQHAHAMLCDPYSDRLRVIDVALASGFNDVSYFNRCFRRRFAMSPRDARAQR